MQTEMTETLLTVRMLSVIERYGDFPSFAAFLSEWGEREAEDKERQIAICTAALCRKENGHLLTLTEEGGGCTHFRYYDGKPDVTVLRRGEMQSEMRYIPKKITPLLYATPFGTLEGEIYTEEIRNTLTEEGGSLTLRYFTVLGGAYQRATLKLTVQ